MSHVLFLVREPGNGSDDGVEEQEWTAVFTVVIRTQFWTRGWWEEMVAVSHGHTLPWDGCLLGCSAVHHQDDECPDDGGSKDLWNFGKPVPDYTALQPRRQPSSYSPPWEPQMLLTLQCFHVEHMVGNTLHPFQLVIICPKFESSRLCVSRWVECCQLKL
jgi:hypothetical protein